MILRQSELFSKTLREAPSGEEAVNAILLSRGGFIYKEASGVYDILPLGQKVLDKINQIIREEMNAVGGQELHMSVLQNKDTWSTTGRWETAKGVMYQFKDASGREVGLGWTHEEPLSQISKLYIISYKDLPKAVYQIQTKFRNEPRAKSGLLRGREFLMKDLYSFHADEQDLNKYYEEVAQAYAKIFKRVGLDARRTLASGGLFSKYSDEFQVISDAGEDSIFYCTECRWAANAEVAGEMELKDRCPDCSGAVKEGKSIEVGNIFKLGTKFSEAFSLHYTDADGSKKPVVMASYGIGPTRLLATVVEVSHDDKGIIWPAAAAPFDVHLLNLHPENKDAVKMADDLAESLKSLDVLYDDRAGVTAGEKFADRDLVGIPKSLVVSEKGLADKTVEVINRADKSAKRVSITELKSELNLPTKNF